MSINSKVLKHDVKNDFMMIELEGDITENADFKNAFPVNITKNLMIVCKNIKKINSTGVKKWFTFFEDLCKKEHVLIFKALSPLLVEQKNQISNFLADGELYTIMIPFQCKDPKCSKEFYIEADLESIAPLINFEDQTFNATPECPFCKGTNTEFGDFVDEYFSFLNHRKSLKKVA